jgi:putative membrane protein
MLENFALRFSVRWGLSALGLWIAASLLGSGRLSVGDSWTTIVGAGFFVALVNMALKPLLVVLSFPAVLLSLGLFMLIINGFVILVASWIYSPLYVKNLGVAIVTGLILGLVNFLVSKVLAEV